MTHDSSSPDAPPSTVALDFPIILRAIPRQFILRTTTPSWLFIIVAHLKSPIFFHFTGIPLLTLTGALLVLSGNNLPKIMPIGEELTNELHQKRPTIILCPMGTCHLGER
jgi:hypothetical protein